eukprot:21738_1
MSYQDTDTEVACLIVTYSPYGPYRGLTYNAHPMRSNSHIPFHKARIFSFHHLHAILSDNITQILISYSFPQYLHLYSLSFFPIFCFFVGLFMEQYPKHIPRSSINILILDKSSRSHKKIT